VNLGNILVEGQAVECANAASSQMFNSKMDGLLGLAFGTLSGVKPKPVKTPVDNMILQGDIKDVLPHTPISKHTHPPRMYEVDIRITDCLHVNSLAIRKHLDSTHSVASHVLHGGILIHRIHQRRPHVRKTNPLLRYRK
jgi:hypothetical protein